MKICSKCKVEKPLTESYYHARKDSKDGYRADCKECRSKVGKLYYENNQGKIIKYREKRYKENREEILKKRKIYQKANKEKIAERKARHYEANKEQYADRWQAYYEENKEEISLRQKQYYQENREEILRKGREYQKENLHVFRRGNQSRKARQKKVKSTLTVEQWLDIKKEFNFRCSYCGMSEVEHFEQWDEQLNQEHFIALTRGGGYTHNNIIPTCRSCNSSKGNKDFFEWYPTYRHYSKEREQFILEYLGYENSTQQLTMQGGVQYEYKKSSQLC